MIVFFKNDVIFFTCSGGVPFFCFYGFIKCQCKLTFIFVQTLKTLKQQRKSSFMWWEMKFITASKGVIKLIRNNFMYHLNKTLENGNTY